MSFQNTRTQSVEASPISFPAFRSKLNPTEQTLHDRFVLCGKNAKEWTEQCKQMLPEIDRLKIWKKGGFESIFHYAAALAGMSRWAVTDALRILNKAEDLPEVLELIEECGVGSARPIITIATSETAKFWVKKARQMTKNGLETYVKEVRKRGDGFFEKSSYGRDGEVIDSGIEMSDGIVSKEWPSYELVDRVERGPRTTSQPEEVEIAMTLDPRIAEQLKKLKGDGDWNSLMKEFLELRDAKIEGEKPESVKTDSRHIPAKIERYAVRKTRGQCAYPGCVKSYKILHHTQRWALEKIHDPDRLVPLCLAHNEIVHLSLVANEDGPVEEWGILVEPTWWDLKILVDQRVQEFRRKWGVRNEGWITR